MNLSEFFNASLFRFGRRLRVAGFDARVLLAEPSELRMIETRLVEALSLVSHYSPIRYSHLRRDLPRLWVCAIPAAAAWCLSGARMCLINLEYLTEESTTPARLALTLVHEGTHARLARAGFKYTDGTRARMERICFLTELILARRLPDSPQHVGAIEQTLGQPDSYFSRNAQTERELREISELGLLGRLGARMRRAILWVRRARPFGAA
jgi:hypothetical protein